MGITTNHLALRFATLLFFVLFICTGGRAQVTITGHLLSEHDSEPLSFGNVYAQNSQVGTQADSSGYFELTGLYAGSEILNFSHIGCDAEARNIDLRRDTQITVYLHHHDNYVETVTVAAKAFSKYGAAQDEQATEELSDALENLTGVSTLRTGTAAAKPIYDGLFGNRLSLQNNGIAQSGQQWGNDHSPEIDPWIAAYLRVVEGVEALRYAGPTAGATVLIEPAPLRETERFSGKAAYTFQSNGLGQVLNARISNGGKTAYRFSTTGKLRGDRRAPDYFLRNTGRREANAALQLARFHNEKWTSRLYLSTFNTQIGVLRGSTVSNENNLREAINRGVPFFTEEEHSFELDAPRQLVSHHLVKAETEFRPNEDNRFALKYGGQLNDRQEFDIRRGGRTSRAALSLLQFSHLFEGSWHRELGTGQHLDANLQFEVILNDNAPGTGVFPLIPDYNSNRGSGYLAYHFERDRFQVHAGLRYDRQFFEAITISRELGNPIERFEHVYNLLGASTEARWQATEAISLRAGLTYRERAPQINELYSNGLHQGVSAIELGRPDLVTEKSLKASFSALVTNAKFGLNATVYAQPISDYIFLQPRIGRPSVTIRGVFLVFQYTSVDALLTGVNLQGFYQVSPELKITGAYAEVRGREMTSNNGIVFIPPANFRGSLSYQPTGKLEGWELGAAVLHVAEQTRIEEEQDFIAPPAAYTLVDASVNRKIELKQKRVLTLRASAENLLNTSYRDYLDRQRYFADAPGIDLELGVSITL